MSIYFYLEVRIFNFFSQSSNSIGWYYISLGSIFESMSTEGTIHDVSKEFFNEINSNFKIIQAIKAADQLFYKDKMLYTAIKSEVTRGDTSQHKEVEKCQQIQKSGKKRTDVNYGEASADSQKQNDVLKENGANTCSLLQEMIVQAKKTVEQALCSSHGSLAECQQNSMDVCREGAKVSIEDLAKLLNTMEQRLSAVERLTEGIARKVGYSD